MKKVENNQKKLARKLLINISESKRLKIIFYIKLKGEQNMDFKQIKASAETYEKQMTKFLRDLVAIPGESCEERGVVERIAEEMKAVGFDKVEIDPQGNVLG